MNTKLRWLLGAALALLVSFSLVGVTHATAVKTGQTVTVNSGEVIDHSLYTAGQTVDLQGAVNGDVICAGNDVTIESKVDGDVICAAQNFHLSGEVTGSLRVAGQTVTISGKVDHNATVAANDFHLEGNGLVARDLAIAANTATINGKVGRDITATGNTITFTSTVGRDVNLNANSIQLADGSSVGGNFHYRSSNQADIASGAHIAGQTTHTVTSERAPSHIHWFSLWGVSFIYWLLAALLAALLLALLAPRLVLSGGQAIDARPWRTAGIGLLSLFLAPLIIVLCMVTVIGIPIGIFLIFLSIVGLMLSGPLFAYYLGSKVLSGKSVLVTLVVGSLVLVLLNHLPIIGFFSGLAATLFGFGSFVTLLLQHVSTRKWLATDVHSKKAAP